MGHMIEISDHILEDTPHCFLPHHAVIKESSTSTRLRVVFDASFKTSDGSSLNDRLMTGPALQNNIIDVILRWRLYRYTFTADIEKMYRQIWVNENDSYYQLILWRRNPSEPIKIYRLKTVTFGTASAPYLAIRTLNWLAEKARPVFPRATKMIQEEMYVDDLISGADSIEEAERKIREVTRTLGAAGLNLRKWASNTDSLLREVPVEERETTFAFPSDASGQLKMLGIHWNPTLDSFLYSYIPPSHPQTTKRSILSTIARLFDPMGWISPCIIKAKCFLQLLWAKKLTWDEPVDEVLGRSWNTFFQDLEAINRIRLPRWVQSGQHLKNVEIHGFSDASEKAFGAAVYIRVPGEGDSVHMNLLLSKTRVAPLKPVSIPRLELCGAVMLARLLNHLTEILSLTEPKIYAWTDSTITLCWIRSSPSRLETFVGNRVGEIQRLTNTSNWNHIPTELNPADLASRGVLPSALIQERLWWNGPTFLNSSWEFTIPTQPINLVTEEGQKHSRCLRLETEENQISLLIKKVSSFQKVVRIVAYCKRFVSVFRQNHIKFCSYARNLRKYKTIRRPLTPEELDEATTALIWFTQQQMFPDGITKTRGMGSLNPFVDGHGVIRVGGRLSQANIPYNQQHPYILEPNDKLTKLIIHDAHIKTLHGGIQLMMAHLRNKFWIFKLKSVVKKYIHRCVTCYRFRAQKTQQLMGELPAPRVSMSKPFTHTGIDYAGPINIRSWKGRGAKCYKGYLAIFVCLATKALHLEAVSDLTTQAFLAAFRRFAARRGVCAQIYSDCGTNFVGADSELRRLLKGGIQDYNEIANALATEGTKWNFIPPASPHFGGLWEAGVKSVKFHLKRIVGNGTLTFEELTTLLTQVEACLNSRPLCPLTEDPADFQALTPAHFLIGQNIFTVPEPDLILRKQKLVDRWKTIQVHLQTFWNQWQTEYLTRLQHRPKWLKTQPQLKKDDLVLIRDERLPPTRWSLGRIVATYPGADNITRVVQVRTSQGEFRRPITKLCPLPCNDAHQSN